MNSNHSYIITGGPGAGKTTVMEELKRQGYTCIEEVARRIIREQTETGGTGVPWRDTTYYTSLMLEASVSSWREWNTEKRGEILFFDRGIPDTLAYATLIGLPDTKSIREACTIYRYNPVVFLFPPWEEIYCTDSERKQTYEEAVLTYEVIKKTYEEVGYLIREVPLAEVKRRCQFILHTIFCS